MNIFKRLFTRKPINFKSQFLVWLNQGLSENIPNEVVALSFNLFQPAGKTGIKFGIEIIGAASFDEYDEDWACDEIWQPQQRYLSIPIEYSSEDWEQCLEVMIQLIKTISESNEPCAKVLNSKPIGIGFVGGDLIHIKV